MTGFLTVGLILGLGGYLALLVWASRDGEVVRGPLDLFEGAYVPAEPAVQITMTPIAWGRAAVEERMRERGEISATEHLCGTCSRIYKGETCPHLPLQFQPRLRWWDDVDALGRLAMGAACGAVAAFLVALILALIS